MTVVCNHASAHITAQNHAITYITQSSKQVIAQCTITGIKRTSREHIYEILNYVYHSTTRAYAYNAHHTIMQSPKQAIAHIAHIAHIASHSQAHTHNTHNL